SWKLWSWGYRLDVHWTARPRARGKREVATWKSLVLPAPARHLLLLPTTNSVLYLSLLQQRPKAGGLRPQPQVVADDAWRRKYGLLQLDGRAGGLEVLLELLGVFLRSAFLHHATGFGEILRFLQAQAGDGADGLDDL